MNNPGVVAASADSQVAGGSHHLRYQGGSLGHLGWVRRSLTKRLRWRAIRGYLKAGYPKDKVAYWTGMRSLVQLRSPLE